MVQWLERGEMVHFISDCPIAIANIWDSERCIWSLFIDMTVFIAPKAIGDHDVHLAVRRLRCGGAEGAFPSLKTFSSAWEHGGWTCSLEHQEQSALS